ncbi:MAG: tRNA pseudouridine(38-40) synthase TruA [Firmicutes bacterium]|nr:tRNA pseudouridine(38-40) synthase TruA [Bacillota bacterium]
MPRILLTIEYYGKNFCGWQIQRNAVSVQEILENKLKEILDEKIVLHGSGRTDSGVNAISQTAHFDTSSNLPANAYVPKLNNILPDEIKIKEAKVVSGNFHAQYSAKKKTYVYKMYISKIASPLKDLGAMQIKFDTIDIDKMNKACKYIVGVHDFSAFKSARSEKLNNVREIYSAKFYFNDDLIEFKICGNGFLHNMVRILVGTFVDVGTGKLRIEDVPKILQSKDRKKASKTAHANGLYLFSVEY